MSHIQKYFIGCDQCETLFGGPEAGDYDPAEWISKSQKDGAEWISKSQKDGAAGIFAFLEEEALDLGWIRVQYMAEKATVCSPKCATEWLEAPRTN